MTKKRANGEGCFFRRGRGWAGLISVPDHRTGQTRREYLRGRSRSEVIQQAEDIRKTALSGSDDTITVGEWLNHWFDSYVSGLRTNTRMTYESLIRCHILPVLGAVPLCKLTADDIVSMLSDSSLAPKTRQLIQNMFARSLKQALQARKIWRNVAQTVPPIRIERQDHRVLSREELSAFLTVARKSKYWLAYLLIVSAGLRRGEALAMRWSDVALESGRITIRQTLVKTRRGLMTNPPKTKLSKRTIPLPDFATAALSDVPARSRHGLVISTSRGDLVDPDLVWSDYRKLLRSAGLPRITLHDLRHTHASLLLKSGVGLSDISRRLGHSTIRTTADIYAHEVPGEADIAATKMNEIISQ